MKSLDAAPGIAHALVVGILSLAFGLAAFLVTATHEQRNYLGPICAINIVDDGFDPWTGLPHGRSYTCDPNVFGSTREVLTLIQGDVPEDMAGRRAVSVPLGFLLGAALAVGGLQLRRIVKTPNP